MALWDIFQTNTGKVIHKWVHYFPIYERFFQEYVGKPFVLFEIGCGRGGSLQMWKKYFGPHVIIVGLDINPDCKDFEEEQINVRIGCQADIAFLESVIDEFGVPDIVLDDGSHIMSDIVNTFNYLYSKTNDKGLYIVEDLHTAYWEEYEGGVGVDGSFIEKCKSLIDELNSVHTRGVLPESGFSKSTMAMHFYDSMVVFEKGAYGRKYAPEIGNS